MTFTPANQLTPQIWEKFMLDSFSECDKGQGHLFQMNDNTSGHSLIPPSCPASTLFLPPSTVVFGVTMHHILEESKTEALYVLQSTEG